MEEIMVIAPFPLSLSERKRVSGNIGVVRP